MPAVTRPVPVGHRNQQRLASCRRDEIKMQAFLPAFSWAYAEAADFMASRTACNGRGVDAVI
jgi:hypothetical protein